MLSVRTHGGDTAGKTMYKCSNINTLFLKACGLICHTNRNMFKVNNTLMKCTNEMNYSICLWLSTMATIKGLLCNDFQLQLTVWYYTSTTCCSTTWPQKILWSSCCHSKRERNNYRKGTLNTRVTKPHCICHKKFCWLLCYPTRSQEQNRLTHITSWTN